jgi:Tol biopolymer transport system component
MTAHLVAPVGSARRRRALVILAVMAGIVGAAWPWGSGDAASPSPDAAVSSAENGPWIVYQAPFETGVDLGLVRPDGTGSHRIPGGPGNRLHPAWSPDGQWIAYDWNLPTDVAEIAILRADGSEERTLLACDGACYGNGGPAFSPDGRLIGFDGAEGPTSEHQGDLCYLALLDLEGGTATRFLEHPGCEVADSYLRFAPDGERVVFQRDGQDGMSVFVARTDGSEERQLTDAGMGARPDWSPDGELIVLMDQNSCDCPDEPTIRLYTVRPDGSELRPITDPEPGSRDVYPRWLPDGSGILYSHCSADHLCETRVASADGIDDRTLPIPPGRDLVHVDQQPVAIGP